MRCTLFAVLTATLASVSFAQSSSTSYLTDINGRRVEGVASTSAVVGIKDVEKTELSRSINGREVPLEQVEQKVLREDSSGRTVEKIRRRFDATGRLSSTEREVTEEQRRSDGSGTSRTLVYRNDINGNSVEAERRVIETRVQGSTTVTETAVERPTLNGSFEVTGKSTQVAEKTPAGENVSNSDYRRAQSGEFYEAFRRVTQATKSGSQTTVQGAEYEIGATGKMELARQSVAITSKGSDGASVTELSLYDRAADGRSQAHDAPLQIKEQQTIERIPGPGGALTEVVTARRPTLADPTSLGEPRKISETVCRGKCSDEKP